MGAAYPLEMRQKALATIDRSEKKLHVSRMFDISRNTLDEWLKLRAATSPVAAKVYRSRGPAPKIADLDEFRRFAAARDHLTQQQIADEWPAPVSNRTIGKGLKSIGYTGKSDATPRRFAALGNAHQDKDLWLPRAHRRQPSNVSPAPRRV